ncbi:hypothetical protein E2C01_058734 [Portunus trituberculatus]|uniref:Uncharacterized protein n=1 Tax=Portunus trituberculatus TaxID=210409 RepID=A0A5B7H408_PORTR|nr:hypothetical protein [Portunus trituberculatus]
MKPKRSKSYSIALRISVLPPPAHPAAFPACGRREEGCHAQLSPSRLAPSTGSLGNSLNTSSS